MWPDRGSNQRPLDSQSDSLPTALGGPALGKRELVYVLLMLLFVKLCPFSLPLGVRGFAILQVLRGRYPALLLKLFSNSFDTI